MGEVKKTICLFCPPACGMNVEVENNRPVRVESDPFSVVGPICIKAEVIPEWFDTEFKRRLTQPLLKKNGKWVPISWNEALDVLCSRLQKVKESYGPEAVGIYLGRTSDLDDRSFFARRFAMGFGTHSVYGVSSTCWWAKGISCAMTYGYYSAFTLIGANCILIWGTNTVNSIPFAADFIVLSKTKGTKLITVDPRRTLFAKASEVHLQNRPGTDGALALGLIHVIIKEKLYDEEFVRDWVVGFDQLAERTEEYTPERVEEITWVPSQKIIDAARIFATTKPATVFQGNVLDTVENGFYACRAIQALMAITGNTDRRGGSFLIPFLQFSKMAEVGVPKEMVAPAPEDRWPLFFEWCGLSAGAGFLDRIITEKPVPLKALVIQTGNPIITWVDTNKQKSAYEKLDFLAVMDVFMTETAELADLVLPAAHWLEDEVLYNYVGRPLVAMTQKVLEPPESCWPDNRLWLELAKRLGCTQYMPWNSIEEGRNWLLKIPPLNMTVEELRAKPEGVFYASRKWEKYKNVPGWKFNTPSGKIEIYSERLKNMGYDPLPAHYEPSQSPVANPGLAEKYPLILITGLRSLAYLHGQHRDTPTLRAKDPEPMVEINTETARELGINSGDPVIVETPKGAVQMKAAVTSDIHPKVVSVPHAWGGLANQNILTPSEIVDPVWGGLAMRALACRVKKVTYSQAQIHTFLGKISS